MVRGGAIALVREELLEDADAFAAVEQPDASRQRAVVLSHPEAAGSSAVQFLDTQELRLVVYRDQRARTVVLAVEHELDERLFVGAFKEPDGQRGRAVQVLHALRQLHESLCLAHAHALFEAPLYLGPQRLGRREHAAALPSQLERMAGALRRVMHPAVFPQHLDGAHERAALEADMARKLRGARRFNALDVDQQMVLGGGESCRAQPLLVEVRYSLCGAAQVRAVARALIGFGHRALPFDLGRTLLSVYIHATTNEHARQAGATRRRRGGRLRRLRRSRRGERRARRRDSAPRGSSARYPWPR